MGSKKGKHQRKGQPRTNRTQKLLDETAKLAEKAALEVSRQVGRPNLNYRNVTRVTKGTSRASAYVEGNNMFPTQCEACKRRWFY